jgi:DNA-binding transcriptional ArsR family regulator
MTQLDHGPRFPEIDRIVHEPARLAILTVLSACRSADFLFLQNAIGLSGGNLSVQLTKLEEAGLARIRKEIVGKKTRTTASLTARGAKQIAAYWRVMDQLHRGSTGELSLLVASATLQNDEPTRKDTPGIGHLKRVLP